MAGVEAAGFVLAAVPIVLQFLEQYKEGLDRAAVFFRRRKHVEKLAHALLMQHALLGENVKALLLNSGVDGALDVEQNPFGVLRTSGVDSTLQEYMGQYNYQAHSYALLQCEKYVEEVTQSLEGFGTDLGIHSGDLVAVIRANAISKKGILDLGKRVNFTLRKGSIDRVIRELDKSTSELERLQKVITANHNFTAVSSSRRSGKAASFLHRVRSLAERLHKVFSQQWTSGCHEVHEVKLLLDNRLDFIPHRISQRKEVISFDLLISSDRDDPRPLWHETVAEAPVEEEDEDSTISTIPPVPTATLGQASGPRVSLFISRKNHTEITTVEVHNICISINYAIALQKKLRLHIGRQTGLSCDHIMLRESGWDQNTNTTTLERMLTNSSQHIFSLKDRMMLAVNLASCLLQLQSTEWLGTCWTKGSVHFAVSTPNQTKPGYSGFAGSVDTSRPFVLKTFPGSGHVQQFQPHNDAKSALLELGIILLELWHEKTFEAQFPSASTATDYFTRFRLALDWLDDVNNPPTDLYSAAVAQCVKCFFGGKRVTFDWEDMDFRRVILQDIVEPLHQNCKLWM